MGSSCFDPGFFNILLQVLRSSGGLHNLDSIVGTINHDFVEGDIIVGTQSNAADQTKGCSYDHEALVFYINGVAQSSVFRNIRGDVYPVVYGNTSWPDGAHSCS